MQCQKRLRDASSKQDYEVDVPEDITSKLDSICANLKDQYAILSVGNM